MTNHSHETPWVCKMPGCRRQLGLRTRKHVDGRYVEVLVVNETGVTLIGFGQVKCRPEDGGCGNVRDWVPGESARDALVEQVLTARGKGYRIHRDDEKLETGESNGQE